MGRPGRLLLHFYIVGSFRFGHSVFEFYLLPQLALLLFFILHSLAAAVAVVGDGVMGLVFFVALI